MAVRGAHRHGHIPVPRGERADGASPKRRSLQRPAGRSTSHAVRTLLRTVPEWDTGEGADDGSDCMSPLRRPPSRGSSASTPLSVASSAGGFSAGEKIVLPRIRAPAERDRRRAYCRLETLDWHERPDLESWEGNAETAVELRRWASSWAETYYNVLDNSPSPSVAAEMVFTHAEAVTRKLGTPNPVMTAVACVLLDTLVPATLQHHQGGASLHLVELVKTQIMSSIYTTPAAVEGVYEGMDTGEHDVAPQTILRKVYNLRAAFKSQSATFLEYLRREDDHALVFPCRRNERWFIQNYLKRLPYYEQYGRSEKYFQHFKRIIDTCMAAVNGKRVLLQLGVRRWQLDLLRMMMRAWHTTVVWIQRAHQLLLAISQRHRRLLSLRQNFTAWRIASTCSAASNRQQQGRCRIGELMQLDRDLTEENESTEDIIGQLKEKIERVDEDLINAMYDQEDDTSRLDALIESEARWAQLARREVKRFASLRKVFSNEDFELEDGRRAAEHTLLRWAEDALSDAYGATMHVQNFGTAWKSGTLLLALLQYLTHDDLLSKVANTDDATQRVELASQTLSEFGIEVSPDHIFQAHTDVVVCALFELWARFSSPAAVPERGTDAYTEAAVEAACVAEAKWVEARHQLHQYCVYLRQRRAHNSPCEVLTDRQIESTIELVGDFTDFTYAHVVPWPCTAAEMPEASVQELKNILTQYFSDLRKIFCRYARKGRMDIAGYFRFVTDAGLLSPQFKKPAASRLFARINFLNKELGMTVDPNAMSLYDAPPSMRRSRSRTSRRSLGSVRALERLRSSIKTIEEVDAPEAAESVCGTEPQSPANDTRPPSLQSSPEQSPAASKRSSRGGGLLGAAAPPQQTLVDDFIPMDAHQKNNASDLEDIGRRFAKMDKLPGSSGGARTDEVLMDHMNFDSAEFAQFLIHISYMRLPKKHKGAVDLLPILEALIADVLQCNTKDTPLTAFRKQIWDETVQEHIIPHRKHLEALFRVVSNKDDVAAKKHTAGKKAPPPDPNSLSLAEWRWCLEELGVYDADAVTGANCDAVFSQFLEEFAGDDCMVYPEFEDALCTIAVYRWRNPYTPLATKVRMFLKELMPDVLKLVEKDRAAREEMLLLRRGSRSTPFRSRGSMSMSPGRRSSRIPT
eukprot:TRINITY_DN10781_c1_g1_i1.p1 TRINITY_DN10781_c1_g1~~TRINITY_DN10781_c1_g1_i1.p1  ORF type:complete len:1162 (+),score=440.84 TRINITY_DN10781_c1_g1_i1:58-3486(+)